MKRWQCDRCDYQTKHQSNFRRHKKQVHDKVLDYRCDDCEQPYAIYSNSHLVRLYVILSAVPCIPIHLYPVSILLIKVKVCYSAFAKLGGSTGRTKSYYPEEERPVKRFQCDLCDYKTSHCGNFRKHRKRRHEPPIQWAKVLQYRCEKCSPPFATSVKRKLRRHYRTKAHREMLREEALNVMQEKIINNNTVAADGAEAEKVEATVEFKRFGNITSIYILTAFHLFSWKSQISKGLVWEKTFIYTAYHLMANISMLCTLQKKEQHIRPMPHTSIQHRHSFAESGPNRSLSGTVACLVSFLSLRTFKFEATSSTM